MCNRSDLISVMDVKKKLREALVFHETAKAVDPMVADVQDLWFTS